MNVVIGIIVWLLLMIVFREVYCWYAKINERTLLMHKQLAQSKETNRLLTKLIQEGYKGKADNSGDEYEVAAKLELSGEQPE